MADTAERKIVVITDDAASQASSADAAEPTTPLDPIKAAVDAAAGSNTDGDGASGNPGSGFFVSLKSLRDGARNFLPSRKPTGGRQASNGGDNKDRDARGGVTQPLVAVGDSQTSLDGDKAEAGGAALTPRLSRVRRPSGIPPREHAGWLSKRSGFIQQTKRRWFAVRTSPLTTFELEQLGPGNRRLPKWAYEEILASFNAGAGLFFYYKTDAATEEECCGCINLRGCDGVKRLPPERAVGKLKYGFELSAPQENRTYLFIADNEEVRVPGAAPSRHVVWLSITVAGARPPTDGGARAQDLEAWLRVLDGVIMHIRQILMLLSKTTNSSRENLMWL